MFLDQMTAPAHAPTHASTRASVRAPALQVSRQPRRRAALGLSLALSVAGALGLSMSLPQPAQAQTSEAKPAEVKAALVARVLAVWHPEDIVVVMVQRPAASALQQARIALQGRVSAERRDAALKDIAVDVQKYIDEATPIARDAARREVAHTVVPILQQQFSEDELRQLAALLESPVKKKFEQLIPQMERALGQKVAEQSHAAIDPQLQAMTKAVGLKLRAATVAP